MKQLITALLYIISSIQSSISLLNYNNLKNPSFTHLLSKQSNVKNGLKLVQSESSRNDSYTLEQKMWSYKCHEIGYEIAKPKTAEAKEVILLLNGFGVGTFHQHRLIHQYMSSSEEIEMYGIDYLGQGRSWPIDCNDGNSESEAGLIYSIDTWADQVIAFINEVIQNKKLHLVGNSVGGHLSVVLAAKHPSLFQSIVLLNPTPIWGANLFGWSGHLPPPPLPRTVGRVLFDWIRDEGTIYQYLNVAYSRNEAFMGDGLISKIRACTDGKGGHAAFASILWSPPATISIQNQTITEFSTLLKNIKCNTLLIFGKDDPWCKPIYGNKIMSILSTNKFKNKLVELDNVGHCPNHEAPQAVAYALHRWINALDGNDNFVENDEMGFEEEWGDVRMREVYEDVYNNMNFVDELFASFLIK